jgi:ABC-type multidrug transport system fused ATPase/permease subunit
MVIGYIIAISLGPFINIIFPKYVIDELLGDARINVLTFLVAVIVVENFLFACVIRILQEKRTIHEDSFSRIFDRMLCEKAMDMKFSNTEKEETIEAERRAETGMSWYSGGIKGLVDCVVAIISAVITLIGVVYIVFSVSFWIILIAALAVVTNAVVTSKVNEAQQKVFDKTPAINKFYYYIYQAITERKYAKEIRLYNGTDVVSEKALENAKILNEMDNECAGTQTKWGILGGVLSSLSYGFSYCWLGVLAIQGEITISEFVLCVTALETFTNHCLAPIIKNVQDLVMKCNFMSAFIDFINIENEEFMGELEVHPEQFESIEFEHVYFKYPGCENYTLEDISFSVQKGECISLVGLNGAGKSTIVKLLCRLYDVTSGEIRVNGKNITSYKYLDYIRIMAVVFQDFKLFSYSIQENVTLGNEMGEFNGDYLYQICGIKEWIEQLEKKDQTLLYKNYDNEGVEPSGGQAQKLAIARALHQDSPIVILDEPTAALDPISEYEIYNKFSELVKNRTAFYISHRLSSCKFCNRIIVINDKRIEEIGNHDELMNRKGLYARMFQSQAQWYTENV